MKISVFTVLFKDRSIHQTFRICEDLGVDGVELYGREPHLSEETSAARLEEIKALSKEYGLPVIGIGTYLGRFSTDNDADCQRDVERLERFWNTPPSWTVRSSVWDAAVRTHFARTSTIFSKGRNGSESVLIAPRCTVAN